jgi:predicted ester cyclase
MRRNAIVFAFALGCLPSGSSAQSRLPTVSSAEQKVVLSYFHDVLDGRKLELIDRLFHPDSAVYRPEGNVKGIAGVRGYRERALPSFAQFVTDVHDIFESGDLVVVRLSHRATGAGVFRSRIGSYDVKDKSLKWDAIAIFRFRNGKIAEEWVVRDELGMVLSAGVIKVGDGR